MSKNIVVIGSSNTDMVIKSTHLPKPGETILGGTFFMNQGGKGANQAVAAARLGGAVSFIAKTGNDIFGKQAIEGFKKEQINIDHIALDTDNPSGVALISVDENAENSIIVAPGANNTLSIADIDKAKTQIEASEVILMQLEIPIQTVEYVANIAKPFGIKTILNPAPAQKLSDSLLASIYAITPNETEAELLTGIKVFDFNDAENAAKVLRAKGIAIVIITLGSKGAYVQTETLSKIIPAPKVNAIDTTAAGDTFNGALAVEIANGNDIESAIIFANKAASIAVTRLGAQSSAPYLDELI